MSNTGLELSTRGKRLTFSGSNSVIGHHSSFFATFKSIRPAENVHTAPHPQLRQILG